MNTRAWKMEDDGHQARSVLECGGWRGTGLAPLWNGTSAQVNPAQVKAACALTPHPLQSKTWQIFGVLLTFLAVTISLHAQSYSIDWYKISGGGGTSTGSTYQVSGTIGQSDAGGAMTGGSYSLTGGFWSLYSVVQTEGAPLLNITQWNGYAILSWSSPSTGYGLEQTPSLSVPSWAGVTNTPADNGTIKSVTLPVQPGNKCFRLKKP